MFKDLALNLPEEDYRNIDCISYSFVSKFYREGYGEIKNLFAPISTPALSMGSLVDCLLTDVENFYSKYYIMRESVPSDTIVSMVEEILFMDGRLHSNLAECLPTTILNAANKYSYYSNWKDATRINSIIEKGVKYYEKRFVANNRIIVSEDDVTKAEASCAAIKSAYPALFTCTENKEILYQAQFKKTLTIGDPQCIFDDIPMKGMLDLIIVDDKNKVILPYDFKTTSSPEYLFFNSYFKWGYYFQSYIYNRLLKEVIKNTEYQDYSIQSLCFVVVNPNNPHPLMFDDIINPEHNINLNELGIPNIDYIIEQANRVYNECKQNENPYILPEQYTTEYSNNIFEILDIAKKLNIKIK